MACWRHGKAGQEVERRIRNVERDRAEGIKPKNRCHCKASGLYYFHGIPKARSTTNLPTRHM